MAIRGLGGLLALGLVLGLAPSPAGAAFPGQNGKLAFDHVVNHVGSIYTMDPDGSNRQRITPKDTGNPSFSPNGKRLLFDREDDVWEMRPDGSHRRNLTEDFEPSFVKSTGHYWNDGQGFTFTGPRVSPLCCVDIYTAPIPVSGLQLNLTDSEDIDAAANYSPEGSQIIWDQDFEIWVMDSQDGSDKAPLTDTANFFANSPDYSPSGEEILFTRTSLSGERALFKMDSNGSNLKRLTPNSKVSQGVWSPNGNRIAFTRRSGVYVMSANGTNEQKIAPKGDESVAWGAG